MKKVQKTRCSRHGERKQIRDLPKMHEHTSPVMNVMKMHHHEPWRMQFDPSPHVKVIRPRMMKKKHDEVK